MQVALGKIRIGGASASQESKEEALERIHGELGKLLGPASKEAEEEFNPALDALSERRETSQADTSCLLLLEEAMKPDLGVTQWWILAGWLCQVCHGAVTMTAFAYDMPRQAPIYNTTVVERNNTEVGLSGNATVNVTVSTTVGYTTEPVYVNPFLYISVTVWFAAAMQVWYLRQSFSFTNRRSPLWHQRYIVWPGKALLLLSLAQCVTLLSLLLFQKGIGILETLPKALSNTEIYIIGVLVLCPFVIASLAETMSAVHLLGALSPNADAARLEAGASWSIDG